MRPRLFPVTSGNRYQFADGHALRGLTTEVGSVGFRIAGTVGGYFLSPLLGIPSIIGAIIGYLAGAGFSRLGGED